jgi:ELWxxDGT repeat protein
MRRLAGLGFVSAVLLALSAGCSDDSNDNAPPPTYRVSGTVSGVYNPGLVLRLNGQEDLAISSNGTFSFATELSDGSPYTVTLASRPPYPNHTCALSNGTGIVDAADVTNVDVSCKVTIYLQSGTQLYVTDGTADGTAHLKDLAEFAAPSGPIVVAGEVTFFRSGSSELWRTDGSAVGTLLIKKFEPYTSFNLYYLTAMGAKIYFMAQENFTPALWASDGSPVGTAVVSSVNPYGDHFSINDFVVANNSLFFGGFITGTGFDLWKSDGTEAGTVRVKDFEPGWPIRSAINLFVMSETVYFAVEHDGFGIELWKSDGTDAGTVLVKDINPGPTSSSPSILAVVGTKLFFLANDGVNSGRGLWASDGTEAGTRLLRTNMTGGQPSVVGNHLYYFRSFYDSTANRSINELWKSDGTEVGTQMVKDLYPSSPSGSSGNRAVIGQTLYFYLQTPAYGAELWRSDGTDAGTFMVKDINPGTAHGLPHNFMVVGDTLYFLANDGVHGSELWRTDGTEAGTVRVTDQKPGGEDGFSAILLGPEADDSR